MRTTTIIGVVVLLAAVSAGAYLALKPTEQKPTDVLTAEARKQTVIEKVRAVGHVEPVTQVNVSANVTGFILTLPVIEGQVVKKGTLLAEIDRERLASLVRQSEANLRSAEAEVQLQVAQKSQAESERVRTEGLAAKGLATPAELEKARTEVALVVAREESAKQRVAQAKGALDEATENMAKSRLYAPIDGTIITLNKKLGERIRASDLSEDVLLILAPLHAMQVIVDISEQDVVRLAVGQIAEVGVDALKPKLAPGKVVEIANSAIITGRGTEAETTTFRVKVALDEIPDGLRSGMSAAVSIVTKTHEGVVAVPIEAVTSRVPSDLEKRADAPEAASKGMFFKSGGGGDEDGEKKPDPIERREKPLDVVFVVSGTKVEPVKVKTGISSDLDVEILDGLQPGQELVIGPYKVLAKDLMPGTTIKVMRKLAPPSPEPTQVTAQ